MTEVTKETTTPNQQEKEESGGFTRYLIYAAVGLVAVILLPLIVGLIVVFVNTDTTATAERFSMIRDVIIIIMSLQAVLIVLALVVLVLQIARLVVMLQTEVNPILDEAKKTAQTAKGTAEFVGKNVTTPLIQAQAFSAGAFVFLREFGGIRRAIRKNGRSSRMESETPMEVTHGE